MRKSVEHLGPQHQPALVEVASDLGFYTCPEFEGRRFEFMRPLLELHARVFPRNPFPGGFPQLPVGGRCYDQAALVSSMYQDLTYCEGVILAQTASGPFALPHAWCALPDGAVVDPTGHKSQHRVEFTYVGVPVRKAYVFSLRLDWGFYGLLDGHPELGDSVGVYADPPSKWLADLALVLPRWHHG